MLIGGLPLSINCFKLAACVTILCLLLFVVSSEILPKSISNSYLFSFLSFSFLFSYVLTFRQNHTGDWGAQRGHKGENEGEIKKPVISENIVGDYPERLRR